MLRVKDLVVFARICRKQGITEEQLADYVQDLRMMHDMVIKEVADDFKRQFAEVSASMSGLSSVPVSGLGLDEKWLRKAQEASEKYMEKRDAADHVGIPPGLAGHHGRETGAGAKGDGRKLHLAGE